MSESHLLNQFLKIRMRIMGSLIRMDEDQVGDVIRHLKATGLSILIVEQNIELACSVADEVMIMNKGTIVWKGTPVTLLNNEEIQHKYLGV
ncbi:hypothetical protein [Paenibacillus sp.]|uniref:hypothetical protein n=1 Tax=Paenibacillus sp. TaxID=58172 RepID=UPI003568391C